MYARGNYDRDSLTKDLGKVFLNADVSFKPWPSCAGTHPYIGATLQLADRYDISPGDVEEIKFFLYSPNTMLCEPLESKRKPVKAIDAKFSIPFTIGTALVHRKVTLDHFTPEALRDNDVLEVTRKITYEAKPISRDDYASPKGLLQIKTRQEKIDSEEIEFLYGHPKNPISREALVAKFMDCAAYSARKIPDKDLNRIVELISHLEDVKDVGEIMKYL